MLELHSILGIKGKRSLPWVQRCNGIVERMHRTLETAISHWANAKPRSWDKMVSLCVLSINCQASASTGVAPFKLMFGHNARLPLHFVFGQPPIAEELPEYEYNVWLEDTLYEIEDYARTKLNASMQSVKDRADRGQRGIPLNEGDFTWLLKGQFEGGCRKFTKKYTGPYKVHAKVSNTTYQLLDPHNPTRTFKAHFNRLKRCTLPENAIYSLDEAIKQALLNQEQSHQSTEEDQLDEETDEEVIILINPNNQTSHQQLNEEVQPPHPTQVQVNPPQPHPMHNNTPQPCPAPVRRPATSSATPATPRRSARLATRPRRTYNHLTIQAIQRYHHK